MSKTHGPDRGLPETTSDLSQTSSQGPETMDAPQTSPEALHEQGLGNSERAARLGLGGGAEMPALADLDVDAWMNDGDEAHTAPLPYKAELERGFGADLSGVQVRLGAEEELHAQGAEATADGETLSFASKHPDRELVAHEVAHLVQSREHGGSSSSRVSEPNEAAEVEADAAAKTVAEGGEAELNERVTGVMRAKNKKSSNKKSKAAPKNNSGDDQLIERWGVTVKDGKEEYDAFLLNSDASGYASDGHKMQDVGGNAVNLNLKMRAMSLGKGSEDCIMAHLVNVGKNVPAANFWVPLSGISTQVAKGAHVRAKKPNSWKTLVDVHQQIGACVTNSQRTKEVRAARAGKKHRSGMPLSLLIEMVGNINKQIGINFRTWEEGWNAEMKDQLFILENCNIKHKSSGEHSGNLLKDYLMDTGGGSKPLYLNMNVPQGGTAAVVGDSIRPDQLNAANIWVEMDKEKTTSVWAGRKSEIDDYEDKKYKNEILSIPGLENTRDAAKTKLQGAEQALENHKAATPAPVFDAAQWIKPFQDYFKADGEYRDAKRELKNAQKPLVDSKKPKANQNVATLTWRYIRANLPNVADQNSPPVQVSGWVPFEMTKPKRP